MNVAVEQGAIHIESIQYQETERSFVLRVTLKERLVSFGVQGNQIMLSYMISTLPERPAEEIYGLQPTKLTLHLSADGDWWLQANLRRFELTVTGVATKETDWLELLFEDPLIELSKVKREDGAACSDLEPR